MEALSSEWRRDISYVSGDRVAFKIGDSIGVAAFECISAHVSSNANQPESGGNAWWKHYPRGFPRKSN